MRSAILARAFPVSLFIVVVGAPACSIDTTGTGVPTALVIDAPRQLDDEYESCPYDPAWFAAYTCDHYHGTTPNAYCAGGACFQMSYGDEVRVVAADELGAFPNTWFAWHEGTMTPSGGAPCDLTDRGNKTRVEIADGPFRGCQATLSIAGNLYFEHFASNAANGCLGWLECKAP